MLVGLIDSGLFDMFSWVRVFGRFNLFNLFFEIFKDFSWYKKLIDLGMSVILLWFIWKVLRFWSFFRLDGNIVKWLWDKFKKVKIWLWFKLLGIVESLLL